MDLRRLLGWTLFALVGVLLAVALTMAASELTSQRIGLQDEPLSAGNELAPARPARDAEPRRKPAREKTPEPAPAEEAPAAPAPPPQPAPAPAPVPAPAETDDDGDESGDDSSGRGRGRGRGRGGDDDD